VTISFNDGGYRIVRDNQRSHWQT